MDQLLEIGPCRVCGKMTASPTGLCSKLCWEEVYNEDERDFRDEDERRPDNDETENGEEDEEV